MENSEEKSSKNKKRIHCREIRSVSLAGPAVQFEQASQNLRNLLTHKILNLDYE
jgi:hypothetical protein